MVPVGVGVPLKQIIFPAGFAIAGPEGLQGVESGYLLRAGFGALSVALGPEHGGLCTRFIAPDNRLWRFALDGVPEPGPYAEVCDGDLALLAWAHGARLHLESRRTCVQVDLPEMPTDLSVVGADSGSAHLVAVFFAGSASVVRWQEPEDLRLHRVLDRPGIIGGALLAGSPPLLAVRVCEPATDRLLLVEVGGAAWLGLRTVRLPDLLIDRDTPLALRRTPDGPAVLAGLGRGLRYDGREWTVAPFELAGGLPTRDHREPVAIGPQRPLGLKQPLPYASKLAVRHIPPSTRTVVPSTDR